MKTRVFSTLLAALLLATSVAGCAGKAAPSEASETPATESSQTPAAEESNEPSGKVRMMVNITGGKDEEEMNLWAKALSEATGLEVELEKPPSDYNKVLMQKLQSGEKYDLIYLNNTEYRSLILQDALLDITDRVKGSEILSGNVAASEWADITVDGKIYGGFNKKELHRVVALNKVHLEKAGIDYKAIDPTLDGYYEVFKALKASNPAKDYYPLNIVLAESYDLQPWMASAGLKNGVVTDSDGKTYSPYSTAAAAPVWEWLKKLYDEQLLDPAAFVDQTKDMRAKMGAASQNTGVTVDWAMWVGLHNANALAGDISAEEYEIVSLPGTKTPDGSYMLVKGGASLFGVPVNAENPDGALKILEFFATQEGGELLSIGIKDHDYTIDASGKYELTEIGKQHASDHGAPRPIFEGFKHPTGYNPGVDEALTYVDYSSIDMPIPDEDTYKRTVGKWGIQMVKGEVSIEDGLAGMAKELVALGLTDK